MSETSTDSGYLVLKSKYQLFLSNDEEDVVVKDDDGDGRVMGVVICKGNVKFDPNVKNFEGLIVTGGKILVDHSINFVANREVIKSILDECNSSTDRVKTKNGAKDLNAVLDIFKTYTARANTTDKQYSSMKDVSAVQYEDVVSYKDWMRNVD